MPATVAAAILLAFILADVLSVVLRAVALRYGITDRPGARKAHREPTPYLGGVAIAIATLASSAAFSPSWNRLTLTMAVAGTAMSVLGLIDDIRPMNARSRLLVEGLAATAVVLAGQRIEVFGSGLDVLLTAAWIVVLTNSFNLLDNMDGTAATVALGCSLSLGCAAYLTGERELIVPLTALAAGCCGFLVHNWAPARMFMGDTGSLFIGFIISVSTVQIGAHAGPVGGIAQLLLFTFVATVDTCLVMISRHRAGRSVFMGGTDHASHRLHRLGRSVPHVAVTLLVATAASSLCAVLICVHRVQALAALGATLAVAAALICLLLRVPVYEAAPGRRGDTEEQTAAETGRAPAMTGVTHAQLTQSAQESPEIG